MTRQKPAPTPPLPVQLGQVRTDGKGGTIRIEGLTPSRRWLVVYPGTSKLSATLSEQTLQQLYPGVIAR